MNSNDQYPMGRPDETTSRTYAMSGKIMLSAIVILFFVVILMVFLHLYARWYLLRARRRHFRRRNRNRRATMVFFAADPSPAAATAVVSRGLDAAVMKSLPVFAFSESTHGDLTECAVCLSEFEEGESGRVLPNCKHTFHVECIDMWFHSHSTCPLCRSLVEATPVEEDHVVIAVCPEPVPAIEPGSSSGLRDEPDDLMRKPAGIEVPRRNLSEFEDDLSHSFRSPMSRMLSFTRMLSRGNASSPMAGAPPQSPSSNCRIATTESDIERGGEEIR